jgi:hypothetical protein
MDGQQMGRAQREKEETMTEPDRATFQLKRADEGLLDIGSVAIGCQVDFDMERKEWRAWDEHGNEAWADWKPLAAARLFVARMERDMEAE